MPLVCLAEDISPWDAAACCHITGVQRGVVCGGVPYCSSPGWMAVSTPVPARICWGVHTMVCFTPSCSRGRLQVHCSLTPSLHVEKLLSPGAVAKPALPSAAEELLHGLCHFLGFSYVVCISSGYRKATWNIEKNRWGLILVCPRWPALIPQAPACSLLLQLCKSSPIYLLLIYGMVQLNLLLFLQMACLLSVIWFSDELIFPCYLNQEQQPDDKFCSLCCSNVTWA